MTPANRTLALLAAGLCAAALPSGCGRDQAPDVVRGKELFIGEGTCGSCHALRRAGTKGTQGPDLDAAFGPARGDGLGEDTVEGVVMRQIANVRRNSIMPADLVTGQDAEDVAAYVALVAGEPGEDTGALAQAGQPKVSNKPVEAKDGTLEIDADPSGALSFVATKANAVAGALDLISANESPIQHNIAVKDGSVDEKGPVVNTGGTSEVNVNLKPGTYTFYCSVPGHEEGGMTGTLTVK